MTKETAPPTGPGGSSANPAAAQPDDGWRRLSTRMLLIHPVREVTRFLPALIAAFVVGSSSGQHWWGLAAAGGAVVVGILRWLTTSYRFTGDRVQLRDGLLNRNTVAAPIDRVRSVDVTAPMLHRVLGLAEVRIGTGAGEKEIRLAGLTSAQAAALRTELLHRGAAGEEPPGEPGHRPTPAGDGVRSGDEVVYRLRPSWIRYAPFGPAGLIAALAVIGVAVQFLNESGLGWGPGGVATGAADRLAALGVVAAVGIVAVGVLVVVGVLSLVGYVLSFHGFRLSRDDAGRSYHVSRGLLTTRATSLEMRRMRGVEVHRPVPLRWVGGARLSAITTGVREHDRQLSTTLTPPSPDGVVHRTADLVLGGPVLDVPLTRHGAAATRRRYTRAVVPAAVLCLVGVGAACVLGRPQWGLLAIPVLPLALAVGASRARWLGHAVTDRHLVTRHGSLAMSTDVIDRQGAVAVTIRRSFVQRRAGVATVILATAAGDQEYPVVDVAQAEAATLAAELLPGELHQFMR